MTTTQPEPILTKWGHVLATLLTSALVALMVAVAVDWPPEAAAAPVRPPRVRADIFKTTVTGGSLAISEAGGNVEYTRKLPEASTGTSWAASK